MKLITLQWRVQGRVIALVILLLAVGGVARLGMWVVPLVLHKMAEKPVSTPPPPTDVSVALIRAQARVTDVLELPAVVEANRIVTLSAEVAARAERTPFQEGAQVRANDAILYLNTDLLQPEHDRARASVELARKQYERKLELTERGVTTKEDRDQAASAKAVAEANLAAAKARLERAIIYSPIDGILNSLPVEVGEYIQEGDAVAEIVDVETVKVVVHVPERDVGFFKAGDRVHVLIDGDDSADAQGAITYISAVADEATHATRVEVTVSNATRVLRCGQIVKVRMTRRVLADAIMVPLAAVIPLEHGHAVYVVEEGKAQRREVKLGLIRGLDVQVTAGLAAGDSLIVAGHRFVGPGQIVNVVQDGAEGKGAEGKGAEE